METLTRTKINPIGDLEIKSDVGQAEFFDGLGSFVTFEPEQGGRRIDAVIVEQDEPQAMMELTNLLAESSLPAATEVKELVEQRIGGPLDWTKIASRYEQLTQGR